MNTAVYQRFCAASVTDDMLEEAATLFSENYGVWIELAASKMGKFAKAGMLKTMN
jgi:hypothetical protein